MRATCPPLPSVPCPGVCPQVHTKPVREGAWRGQERKSQRVRARKEEKERTCQIKCWPKNWPNNSKIVPLPLPVGPETKIAVSLGPGLIRLSASQPRR